MFDTMKAAEDFEYWLVHMDDALDEFYSAISVPRNDLDFSPQSLDLIEDWVLSNFKTPQDLLAKEHSRILDGLARYVGETFRENLGGRWEIRFDDPKYVFYGLPQLTFGPETTPDCPLTLVTASADRRKGNFIRTVLENSLGKRKG